MSRGGRAKKAKPKRYFGEVFQRTGRKGWYVRFRYGNRRVKRFAGLRKKDAENYLAEIMVRIKSGERPFEEEPAEVPFKEFLEEHLRHLRTEHSESTLESEIPRLKNRIGPRFDGLLLSEIGPADVEAFLADLAEGGAKPATRNRYLALLSGIFARAVRYGHLASNPCEKVQWLKTEEKAIPYLEPAEQARLLECMPERLKDFALLAIDTGARRGVLLRLTWSDVDFARNVVVLQQTKNKSVREIPMTRRLRERLRQKSAVRTIPLEGPDLVLSELPRTWTGHIAKLFRQAVAAAGHPGLTPHGLRHLFGTNLARSGVPIPDIQRLMGHRSISMTLRYAKHAPENAGSRAIEKMERHLGRTAEARAAATR